MTVRNDLSKIKPLNLKSGIYGGTSTIESLVLASSNALRDYLALSKEDLLPLPIPKFVTRKDPSLDNYCADLLLRTLYEPTNSLPIYEEHIIRDDQNILSSIANPRLVGAVLIGIGGQSKNPDFKAIYDEHADAGTRTADSTARIVINRHLSEPKYEATRKALQPLMDEVDWIDAHGHAPGNHLSHLVDNLHVARYSQPGFVSEELEPQWKRAIMSSILSAMFIATDTLQSSTYDNDTANTEVEKEYDKYIQRRSKIVKAGYLTIILEKSISDCREQFKKGKASQVNKKLSLLTPAKILTAMKIVWPTTIVSFIFSFLVEARLQTQDEFNRLMATPTPKKKLSNGLWYCYHELTADEMLPHRALLKKLNDERKAGIVVVYNPSKQITAIFRSNFLKEEKWDRFVKILQSKEGQERWYAVVQESGKISDFVLNGTSYFVGVPMTDLDEEGYMKILETIRD